MGPVRLRAQIVLVHQRTEDDPGQIGEHDGRDVLEEMTVAFDYQGPLFDQIDELHGSVPAGGPGQTEAQLVYGQPKILDLVIAETQSACQPGGRHPGQAEELGSGGHYESHLVGRGHDLRTVAVRARASGRDRLNRQGRSGAIQTRSMRMGP